jgi:hypothetical protein
MLVRIRQLATLLAAALLAGALSGCGTMNEKMSAGMADSIPAWAGGLPEGAPPRPGTAKYDEYMQERERLRQMPAADRPGAQQQTSQQQTSQQQPGKQQPSQPQNAQARATPSGLDPVH